MISAAALIFLVNAVTSFIKNYVIPNVGPVGTQIILFGISLIAAVYVTFRAKFPGIEAFLTLTLSIFSLAVTFYEVILSKLPFFRKSESSGEISDLG